MSIQIFVTESTRRNFPNFKVEFAFTVSVRPTFFFALDDLIPMVYGNNALDSLVHKGHPAS